MVWPYQGNTEYKEGNQYLGTAYGYNVFVDLSYSPAPELHSFYALYKTDYTGMIEFREEYGGRRRFYAIPCDWVGNGTYKDNYLYSGKYSTMESYGTYYKTSNIFESNKADTCAYISILTDTHVKFESFDKYINSQHVPSITAKTANKLKLPTRLPQTVINNINSYYNRDTENLIISPTANKLPQLPDGYNPVTDELPDLPGYEDVTPDQEPTTDPEPTPTPPDPTPTPPEYNGDEWVNPIGNFFDGLLKFMKAAFATTLSLDLSALSNMPENFTDKFPFSLPSDIVSIFGVIDANPVAPSFSFIFPLSYVGGEDMDPSFNLDAFNDAAAVIRSLLLLVVVVLLAWKTYGLVGGDS